MNLDDPRRPQLALALEALAANPNTTIKTAQLKHFLTAAQLSDIERLRADIAAGKKRASPLPTYPDLKRGSEAEAYWKKALRAINAGRLAQNLGSREHERTAAKLSEQAEEHWEAVEDEHRHLFKQHTSDADGELWDERWAFTEWRFPLLLPLPGDRTQFPNALNYAQRSIIAEALEAHTYVNLTPAEAKRRFVRMRDLARGGE